jgi:hypothetical protein
MTWFKRKPRAVTAGPEHAIVHLTDWPTVGRDLFEAETLRLARMVANLPPEKRDDWDGGRRIRAHVVKRDGYWVSVVRGSDGWVVLYNDVGAKPSEARPDFNGWAKIMDAALDDCRIVHRVEQAGARLPEYKHLDHY